MKDRILSLLLGFSSKLTFSIIIGSIFIGYYGVYSLFGNKVITKTNGMILLPAELSLTNIAIGVISILYIFFKK